MDKESALDFLRQHQPMADDVDMFNIPDLLERYSEVRQYFEHQPAIEAVPLFLNPFGEGSGFGIYQLVEDALTPFPAEAIVPHLLVALNSELRSVRYWSADIALNFPSSELVPSLQRMLEMDDADGQSAAASALAVIADLSYKPIKSEEDYKSALAQIDRLSDAQEGTEEFDQLDVLVTLVEAYEAKHYPIGPPSFEAAVEYEMEKRGNYGGDRQEKCERCGGRERVEA